MGCLHPGMWEKTQGRLEMETRDFSGKETETRNRRDRKEKKSTGNRKNMRKMNLFDMYKEAGRFPRHAWQLEHAWE